MRYFFYCAIHRLFQFSRQIRYFPLEILYYHICSVSIIAHSSVIVKYQQLSISTQSISDGSIPTDSQSSSDKHDFIRWVHFEFDWMAGNLIFDPCLAKKRGEYLATRPKIEPLLNTQQVSTHARFKSKERIFLDNNHNPSFTCTDGRADMRAYGRTDSSWRNLYPHSTSSAGTLTHFQLFTIYRKPAATPDPMWVFGVDLWSGLLAKML